MAQRILLVQPPFTQINTPYPATAYLKGFLNTKGIESQQCDLGIETLLALFSENGLRQLFHLIKNQKTHFHPKTLRMLSLEESYCQTISVVIAFLQGKAATMAQRIAQEHYLPEGERFEQVGDLEWYFGNMGLTEKAKYLATLYLEDISDVIQLQIDPFFGFSRYAEKLASAANSFDDLYQHLKGPRTHIDTVYLAILTQYIQKHQPSVVAISIPFPGNVYSALVCAQMIKTNFPEVRVAFGGGYVNTELRSLSDVRVFEFVDYLLLDDGEAPLLNLLEFLEGKRNKNTLKRCFLAENEKVVFIDNSETPDFNQIDLGTPDYDGLPLDSYLSVIELANPMHKLWSDGRWNKLTMAHGCYWGKCTFCDISLDYIKRYQSNSAKVLVDRMETMIAQTGERGFHFVDEAAPPALMRDVAIEILRRKLQVSWWTNIRFEKSFTKDLCQLLAASGCIAVSGGLEVASDRLLKLIDKGVTVAQAAQVMRHFAESSIMVHAYLMYGFPTQTIQETVDSLEYVRQLFALNLLQSGFWHRLAMTAHAPVGLNPELFNVRKLNEKLGSFANNELDFEDPTGIDHEAFSLGLRKSLFNFMQGLCLDEHLQTWFEFDIPETTVLPNYIHDWAFVKTPLILRVSQKVIWLAPLPVFNDPNHGEANNQICFYTNNSFEMVKAKKLRPDLIMEVCEMCRLNTEKVTTVKDLDLHFQAKYQSTFTNFMHSPSGKLLLKQALLLV